MPVTGRPPEATPRTLPVQPPTVSSMAGRRPGLAAALVFAAALAAFLPGIGAQEIWTKDEARTALIVKEMRASGDWSLPRVARR